MMHKLAHSTLAQIFQSAGNRLIDKPPGFRTTHLPVHDSDSGESLHIDTDKGSWRCWSCEQGGGIVHAVESLYTLDRNEAEAWLHKHFPVTVERLAEDKGLPEKFLRHLGLVDVEPGVVTIPYRDQAGKTHHLKRRIAYTAALGSQWPAGIDTMVYGLDVLADARKAGYVILVEGESDHWTLRHHGFPSLGIPGASNVQCLKAPYLEGIRTTYVWKETDTAGAGFIDRVGKRLEALGWDGEAKVICAPKVKDPNSLHKRDPGGFPATFQAILKAATLLRPKDIWKRIKTAPQFLAEPDPEFIGIAKDLVFPQAITVIVSPRGLCKTQTTLSLAVSMARASTFRGEQLRPMRVLLLDRDNPIRYFKRSLRGWGAELADRLHVLGREDAPLLTNIGAWDELPAENYDVVILDSMNSFLEGVTEKEGKALSEAMGTLRTLAYRGPAVLLLGNTIKDGTVYKGRGEVADMVDILYEVRDATDFVPSLKRPWWEELPDAGDSAWATRAFRRKGRLDYRLAFIASKFRVGEAPEPFCVEITFPLDSAWTVADVTEQLMEAGETAKATAAQEETERLDQAALELLTRVQACFEKESPILKKQAEEFLCDTCNLKQKEARKLITDKDGNLWDIIPIPGRGNPQALHPHDTSQSTPQKVPPGEVEFLNRKTEITEPFSNNGYRGTISVDLGAQGQPKYPPSSPCETNAPGFRFFGQDFLLSDTISIEGLLTGNYPTFPWQVSAEADLIVASPDEFTHVDLSDDDELVLTKGKFRQIRMPSDEPAPVAIVEPAPESRPHSTEMLSSPSIEVGPSFEVLPYTYIQETSQLEKVLPDILAARTIGVDTETTGLNPRGDRLRLVQLATPDHSYVIDIGQLPAAMLAPLMDGTRWLIGQNVKFDLQFLVQAGLPWPSPSVRLLDTLLCCQVLDIDQAHSLEAIAHTYLDISLDKSLQISDWSGTLSREQLAYAAMDAQVLLPLARVLRERLDDDHLWSTARLESACTAPLAWIELAGMPVDTQSWQALAERLSQEAQELRQQLSAMVGTSLNWSSWQQILPVLQARGIPVQGTSHKVLIPYVQDDLVATLLKYKQVSKAVSTYGEKWLEHVDLLTKRVHAEFHSLGTAVGRATCTKPNLQQIPRDLVYRQKFCAQEGRCIVKADYSQLHLRIVAVIAPDQAMQAAYERGADLHITTAAGMQHIAESAVTKDHRQHAKVFNFGLLYAMGIPRLQAEAWEKYGVRLSDMQAGEQRKQWFKLYPGIRKWHDREQYAISHDHITETRSLLGRRRTGITYLPDRLSSQVLSIEADGAKHALVELFTHREDVPGARIINTIHDEMLVECDASQVPEVTTWLQTHMEAGMQSALKGKAITPVEVSVGQSWAGD